MGRCQWIYYGRRERIARLAPKWMRYSFSFRWPIWKTYRCKSPATRIDHFAEYEGYRIPVCDKHYKDVQTSNHIEKWLRENG